MEHVMIVEQDSTILKSAEQALKDKYKISAFMSAEHIIEFMKQNQPDLILLDAAMSGSDGALLIQNVSKVNELKGIPAILLIDGNNQEKEHLAFALGAVDFIVKPFLQETIRKRVDTQLELKTFRNGSMQEERFQDVISVSFAELVEFRDETTGGHLKNTTQYFKIMLDEMLQSEGYKNAIPLEDIDDLLRSAPLHDIGKIGINDDILRKTSPLNYHEFEFMKTHTTLGKQAFEKIIRETGGRRWLYLARDIAYCHHERWDGTGYPNGLKGEQIPLYARIMTIADVYDALTSIRTYKEAYSHKNAMEIIIEGKGNLFDPGLVDIFIKANERFEQALISRQRNA